MEIKAEIWNRFVLIVMPSIFPSLEGGWVFIQYKTYCPKHEGLLSTVSCLLLNKKNKINIPSGVIEFSFASPSAIYAYINSPDEHLENALTHHYVILYPKKSPPKKGSLGILCLRHKIVLPIKYLCCPHIETSLLICTANQLTGFYIWGQHSGI